MDAGYLYLVLRIPPNHWNHEQFTAMAYRKGWSDATLRHRWSIFKKVVARLRSGQSPIRLSDGQRTASVELHPNSRDFLIRLARVGPLEEASALLHPLQKHRWRIVGSEPSQTPEFEWTFHIRAPWDEPERDRLALALDLAKLGMVEESTASSPNGELTTTTRASARDLSGPLRELVAEWDSHKNLLALHSTYCQNKPLEALQRIHHLITEEVESTRLDSMERDLDKFMGQLRRLGWSPQAAWDDADISHLQRVVSRVPILIPLWQSLEAQLLEQLSNALETGTRSAPLSKAENRLTDQSWESRVRELEHLHLAGEVLQRDDELRKVLQKRKCELDWAVNRRLLELDDREALIRLREPSMNPLLLSNPDVTAKAVALSSIPLDVDAVLYYRALLPFRGPVEVNIAAAKAYLKKVDPVAALRELEAIPGEAHDATVEELLAVVLSQSARWEEALEHAITAIHLGCLSDGHAPDMVDEIVMSEALTPKQNLRLCDAVTSAITTVNQARALDVAYIKRAEILLEQLGADRDRAVGACDEWTDILIAAGQPDAAWQEYQRLHVKLKPLERLQWLDSLACDIPEALPTVEQMMWQANPDMRLASARILSHYGKSIPGDGMIIQEPEQEPTTLHRRSILLVGARKSIRQQVFHRLINHYGFEPDDLAEIPSPWEGTLSTATIQRLVTSRPFPR